MITLECFKKFLEKHNFWKEYCDPFTTFYLKEYRKRKLANAPDDILPEEKDVFNLGTYMRTSRIHRSQQTCRQY